MNFIFVGRVFVWGCGRIRGIGLLEVFVFEESRSVFGKRYWKIKKRWGSLI